MFTGIVEELGRVEAAERSALRIRGHQVLCGLKLGDSIAVNGACLTVTGLQGESFSVGVMPETLRRSTLGSLGRGDQVNLERALTLGGRVGGHLVQGHLDGTGKVRSLTPDGPAMLVTILAPGGILRYAVEKGFIAVDGISLTVSSRTGADFTVSIVEYTLHHTTLGKRRTGDEVNLEVDIIAKYVERFVPTGKSGITAEFLGEHGFLSG